VHVPTSHGCRRNVIAGYVFSRASNAAGQRTSRPGPEFFQAVSLETDGNGQLVCDRKILSLFFDSIFAPGRQGVGQSLVLLLQIARAARDVDRFFINNFMGNKPGAAVASLS
jgi:hypothetical protein